MRALLAAAMLFLAVPAAGDAFKVIVNPSNAVASLSRAQLSQLFLKKSKSWPSGEAVLPVEPSDPRVRSAFAREVHGKGLNAVKSYWNQVVFSGRDVPPLEKPDERDVVEYVRAHAGAIGFVSAEAGTAGAKIVTVRD